MIDYIIIKNWSIMDKIDKIDGENTFMDEIKEAILDDEPHELRKHLKKQISKEQENG